MQQDLERSEVVIGKILTTGVAIAGSIVAMGGTLYLLRHGSAQLHYDVFTGEPTDLRTIVGVITGAFHMSSRAIIQLGLIVLVTIQIARVAFTVWLFKAAQDYVFVYISLLVLGVLGYSLLEQG